MADRYRVPRIVAHRGASAAVPPGNTLEAFRWAAVLGADGVELDVRRAGDGSLVVHHDADLPDGRPIRGLGADELPEWVPMLEQALEICADAGLSVNIEIKNSPLEDDFDEDRTVVDDVLAAVGHWDASNLLISSFDPGVVARVRGLGALFPTGQLLWNPSTAIADVEVASTAGHVAVSPWLPCINADLVSRAHDLGVEVIVWTVDDEAEMAALIDLGVDAIITKLPDVLRGVLGLA